MKEKLLLTKKPVLKGDDGYKTFSIRIHSSTAEELEKLAIKTDRSRNDVICTLLKWALSNTETMEEQHS